MIFVVVKTKKNWFWAKNITNPQKTALFSRSDDLEAKWWVG